MDFCYWEKTYKKNYPKRDHFANHRVRSKYIIKLLTKLFNVDNYVLRSYANADLYDEDEGFILDFQEMKEEMKKDRAYKQRWFKAAYEANEYIKNLLLQKKQQISNIRSRKSKRVSQKRRQSPKSKKIRSQKRRRSKKK
jgi:hypothetical protein